MDILLARVISFRTGIGGQVRRSPHLLKLSAFAETNLREELRHQAYPQ
ncbi:hypothetical protein LEP1GSC201_2571 [Leptospira interrogans serovar Pomona str. Fox 32256]|nr:hypothetical protein LEP1GSC014_0613 [Leptospira interrogans serovar Pomona str. Pomona]EKO69854.1 hypothetical protein LEP1GSC069_2437 [Leptospira interrogans serovar Canicola str. Fiocruz LV133]EKQ37101.1 hypothetical protein LEP1GSC025_1987 [Leptospira interrogans str. 2002000621]EKR82875.1 hypothetical protein LEP1GSC099_4206 [Leptospira interrogans str. UI 08452]EMF32027.1 hypothetical protein LEP1GSC201_2571 [Leptospira interrogans serovar Pomona str. Fox 32256]EMJ65972.1 hypothetical